MGSQTPVRGDRQDDGSTWSQEHALFCHWAAYGNEDIRRRAAFNRLQITSYRGVGGSQRRWFMGP